MPTITIKPQFKRLGRYHENMEDINHRWLKGTECVKLSTRTAKAFALAALAKANGHRWATHSRIELVLMERERAQ